jgi:hypothetical protein
VKDKKGAKTVVVTRRRQKMKVDIQDVAKEEARWLPPRCDD